MPSSQARWTRSTLSFILLPHRSKLTVHYIYYPVLVYTHKQKFSSFWNCSKVERSSETSTWTSVQAEQHRILQEGMFSLIYCKQICLHRDTWDLTPQFPRLMRYPLGHKTAIYKIWYHVFVLCVSVGTSFSADRDGQTKAPSSTSTAERTENPSRAQT